MSSEAAYFPNALASEAELREVTCSEPEAGERAVRVLMSKGLVEEESLQTEVGDDRLLAEIRDGSKEALGVLFRRHARTVRILAERILRDPAEAEDLVQEVFLFVFRKAGLFDATRGSARSWLVQVAYHRAFDRRRYLASRHHHTNLAIDEGILGAEEPKAALNSYEQTIEAALGRAALSRIEESLTEAQHRVMRLHFLDGHSFDEIAAIFGQTVGNVRNHYYRALEKIRREVFTGKLQGR
jgi:RNA polymerase sigma-70 factor (ECF subfamily)